MTLSDFLYKIKVDKSNPYEIIPISFNLQDVLQEKLYIQTRSGAQKEGITAGKINGLYKPLLPHLKSEIAAKIIFQFPSNVASPNQLQIGTNTPIRRRVGRVGLKREVRGINPLVKPRVFLQSPQVQRPILPSQNLQIPNTERVRHPTFAERKQ